MQQPVAKLFMTGGSQAVRLPAEYRFRDAAEVFIRRDERTGDVILSTRSPADWLSFMKLREQLSPMSHGFLTDREQAAQLRDPFEGEPE